ncbi:MAG: YwbE family protein [Acidobacteria bacterium]|nr:YwbE family protein [Acidobacteriota bacterium]
MDGRERKDVRSGLTVDIVLKQDQRTGRLTRGVVKDVLTKSPSHPHGIKVRLETGEVGRVKEIISH